MMTHEELLEECRRVLEAGAVEESSLDAPATGTFPLNCHISDDIAVVTVATATTEKGVYCSEEYVFEQIEGVWEYLGGGSASADSPCPVRVSPDELGGEHLRLTAHGLTRRRRPALFPDRRWISTAEFQVSDEVALLLLDDQEVAVPSHGLVSVLWPTLEPASVTALASDGRALASLVLEPRTWFEAPV